MYSSQGRVLELREAIIHVGRELAHSSIFLFVEIYVAQQLRALCRRQLGQVTLALGNVGRSPDSVVGSI